MMDRIARLFGVEHRTPYVRAFMERSNMEVMRLFTPVALCMSTVSLVSTLFPVEIWATRTPEMLLCYRALFVGMIAVFSVYGQLSRHYLADASPKAGRGEWHVLTFTCLLVFMNLWITILDYPTMHRYFFLLVALFVLFGLFFVPPLHVLVFELAVFVSTYFGLQAVGELSVTQTIILAMYLVIIFAVSASNYYARLRVGMTDEDIVNAARRDELTNVLNRRAFEEDASLHVGEDLHLMLADIDGFKYYNDLHGHTLGDEMLMRFAETLVDIFGDQCVYRFGNDEFIVVLSGCSQEQLQANVDAWRDAFHNSVIDARALAATSSAGCVHGHVAAADDMHDLLRIADSLLYRSKDEGRNRVLYAEYSDGLLREAITHSSIQELPTEDLDALTKLPGIDFFIKHVDEVAPLLLQRKHSVSIVYFNVANLKDFNAKHGYGEGDKLLCSVADTLREVFPNRIIARFGDDRFGLMAEDENLAEAINRACEIVRDEHRGSLAFLRAGVFRYTNPSMGIRDALDKARIACDSLRGNFDRLYCYYTTELGSRMERRSRVIERFEEALANGYIQPYYQPIIRSVSDLVCEFEILARWIDPVEGITSPADFIPALEDAHLIHLLDLHIVEEVCKNYLEFSRAGYTICPVSINFSRLDFTACDLVDEVTSILDRYGLPHHLIRVELTESAFAEDSGRIKRTLERFRDLGMQVWMDDFGSGYSALNVLRDYSFDLVKFDMGFLHDMNVDDPDDPSGIMLTSLVSMAKELGFKTLIEGVEHVDQALFLRGISFEKIQGFVYGRPHSFDELCEKLDDWSYIIEEPEKRSYYEQVGRVNLMQPVEMGTTFDPLGIAEGIPAAVLEYDGGNTLRYLEHNASFESWLTSIGVAGGILDSEARINLALGEQITVPNNNLVAMQATDDWLPVREENSSLIVGYTHCVARVPNSTTYAFLFYADPRPQRG